MTGGSIHSTFLVDETRLYISMNELHANSVAYIDSMKTLQKLTLNRRMSQPYPCAFLSCASGNCIELLTDS